MKARVKSWEEIEHLIPVHEHEFEFEDWRKWFYHDQNLYGFNPDWLEIIDEDEEIAEIYVHLLKYSGEL